MKRKTKKTNIEVQDKPEELISDVAVDQIEIDTKNKQEKNIKYRSYSLSKRMGIKR